MSTGIDIEKLLEVRTILKDALPDEPLYGFTPDAGLPLNFSPMNKAEPKTATS